MESSPHAALLGDYLQNHAWDTDKMAGTRILNILNPLACALSTQACALSTQGESASRNAALDLVWQLARLFSGRTPNAGNAAPAFAGVTSVVKLRGSRH